MNGPGAACIGVFGGTFDPIHLGHLHAAETIRERLALREVRFVPSALPPHKAAGALAPAELRCRWIADAIASNPHFQLERIEVDREGPSFSVDTLGLLREQVAPAELVFLIGQDAFDDLASWREPEQLLTLAHVAVFSRPGGAAATAGAGGHGCWFPASLAAAFEFDAEGSSGRHREAGTWVRRLTIDALPVSSTAIRTRLCEGRSIRYQVPEVIRESLEACEAYAEQENRG